MPEDKKENCLLEYDTFIKANYVVEASVNSHMKFGSDEGLCTETSAVYINYQYLREFYIKENYHGNTHLDYIISY